MVRLNAFLGAFVVALVAPCRGQPTAAVLLVQTSIQDMLEQPWIPIDSLISFYETFFLEDIDNDFTVAASVVFSLMKKFALDSSFDTMYLSRAEDGAFLGYHNKKDANGSYEMSFLPGWDCPWNYTKACNGSDPCDAAYPGFQPACRHRVDVGPRQGFPACGAWILGKCDVLAFAQGLYNTTCDDVLDCVAGLSAADAADSVYDPRMRPWSASSDRSVFSRSSTRARRRTRRAPS